MKTFILLIFSVLNAVQSVQVQTRYQSSSIEQRLDDLAQKMSEFTDVTSHLLLKLTAHETETKNNFKKINKNFDELSQKFEKNRKTFLKKLNETQTESLHQKIEHLESELNITRESFNEKLAEVNEKTLLDINMRNEEVINNLTTIEEGLRQKLINLREDTAYNGLQVTKLDSNISSLMKQNEKLRENENKLNERYERRFNLFFNHLFPKRHRL